MTKFILITASLLSGLSVAFGAFGAHALKAFLISNNRLETYQTAVQYQFFHALALLFIGMYMQQIANTSIFKNAALVMLAGILIFSGSLYLLCFTNKTYLGAITPIGGVCFIIAWVMVTVGFYKTLP